MFKSIAARIHVPDETSVPPLVDAALLRREPTSLKDAMSFRIGITKRIAETGSPLFDGRIKRDGVPLPPLSWMHAAAP